MAVGNEWINGYLEAILDAGSKLRVQGVSLPPLEPAPALASEESSAAYNPTRYFVEEVVRSFDDQALHKTWTGTARSGTTGWRTCAGGSGTSPGRRSKVERDYSQEVARRKLEQELGSLEAAEDLAELSEGEKETVPKPDGTAAHLSADEQQPQQRTRLARINSEVRLVSDDEDEQSKNRNLYIVLISIHGLVRGENMELGRDSDTGGQVSTWWSWPGRWRRRRGCTAWIS
ncbi:unnamed protein product [Triticum turgidum subsp. durum]|uniref:Sucrose-phosphate synthase n=1 Tax=Triticum turgidum subsp. durum TaxID=4567 RepID=A0A9R0SGH8_TRITD|nr:unnamed protein product [Triticum turgidum subsp. durum]